MISSKSDTSGPATRGPFLNSPLDPVHPRGEIKRY
jgi:hypothetical protein